jgi:dTDP-4-dehydrorhamnose reductase
VDIADASAVDAVLRRTSPWAVINAAGYVRVDTAEREPDVCHRSNVLGPVALAAACRRRAIRFVTFSSDLVFDGRATRPYVEADRPRPLSVYGVAKAEAERRVLELSPEALVIRTSAFFGPWDDANFVTSLMRRLDAGLPCFAAADNTVSPTYVPDLVHASLDLLIDGASGIWHLANRGAATWYELAVRVAELSGRARNMIVPVESARIWQPAERPPYSVLSSERGRVMRSLDAALAAYLQDAGLADAARARLTDSSEQIAS